MHRVAPVLFAAALAASGAALAHAGGSHGRGFRLPDASAACRVESGRLVCRSLAVRAGLSLTGHGTPRAVGGHIWWDASTPVLRRWSLSLPSAIEELQRYPAAVLALLLARPAARAVAAGVLGAAVAACDWALLQRLAPDVFGHGVVPFDHRLAAPVGYSNGMGLLAAIGADRPDPRRARVRLASAAPPARGARTRAGARPRGSRGAAARAARARVRRRRRLGRARARRAAGRTGRPGRGHPTGTRSTGRAG